MTVTNVEKDAEQHTMTITSHFDAPIERVWELWANPRLLERWWGPPTYPATVVDHDLTPGGKVTYFMTGPDGDTPGGWWRIIAAEQPRRLEIEDGFANDDGTPNAEMPTTRFVVTLDEQTSGGTTMTIASTFPSAEVMAQMVEMGMEQGMQEALGQIDGLLAGSAP